MLEELKKEVCAANLLLQQAGLVVLTWGNASGIDRERDMVAIKPSQARSAGRVTAFIGYAQSSGTIPRAAG